MLLTPLSTKTDNTGAHDLQQLWQQVENTEGMDAGWYNKAVEYWDKQEASYDGVLGGFGHVSEVDVRDSEQFLKKARGCLCFCMCLRVFACVCVVLSM